MVTSNERLVDPAKVHEAVRAFRKLRDVELSQQEKKSIIDENERQERVVHLQLTVKKMSMAQKIIMIPFEFPHCLIGEEDEVCFIVGCKESEKGNKRADHERYANEWKHKLRSLGIEREIHVMPVMQLETEFKSYEAKRKLCKAFDHFICDHRLIFKMPKLLGTLFFRRRKMPVRVYMRDESRLKELVEEAIRKTLIHITPEGPNVSMKVGNLADHTDEEIAENICSILDTFIPNHLPGGNANLNSIHLASFVGRSVPLYVSLASANSVDMAEADKPFIEKQTPQEIEDTVDTMPGVRVKVRTDGKVIAVKDDTQKLDTDDLLDEDYLDLFRDQEYEERDEAKKRYMKHLARKAALRRVGRKFGPNMLKLPSHVPVPKPKPIVKPTNMPKQRKPNPPPVPTRDALQGYDEDAPADGDDCPQLVPIEWNKPGSGIGKTKMLSKRDQLLQQSAVMADRVAKSGGKERASQHGFQVSQLSEKHSSLKKAAGKKATTEFVLETAPNSKEAKKKKKTKQQQQVQQCNDSFRVEPLKLQQKSPKAFNKLQGMLVTKVGENKPIGNNTSTPAERKSASDSQAGTPRPILKTPRDSLGHEKRKSVTFDFTPGGESILMAQMKTPKDGEPTPVYIPTPSPEITGGKKRKSLTGGFDLTPMHSNSMPAKKAKKVKS